MSARRLLSTVLLMSVAVVPGPSSLYGAERQAPPALLVGVARCDITPDGPVCLAGYAARDHASLGRKYRAALTDFLQAGDLVKFARYEPAAAEIEASMSAAETFVEQTTIDHETPAPSQTPETQKAGGPS